MGMTIDNCIHKLDFSIDAYQKLIDENVANGEVVGTGVRGTWTASTPLNKAYSDMIEALQTAIDTMRKYQKIQGLVEYHMLRFLSKERMSGFQKDVLEVLDDEDVD